MKVKKDVLTFTYLCFFIALLSAREIFSFSLLVIFLLLMGVSIYVQFKEQFLVLNKVVILVALVFVIMVFFFLNLNLIEFLTCFLIFLTFLKLFSPLTPRDIWQVYALSFALLCISSIWNFNISIGFLIVTFTWSSMTGLCFLNGFEKDFRFKIRKELAICSTIMALVAVLIGSLFFLFLPRTPYTLSLPFGLSQGTKIGFSEEIDIEGVERIRENSEVAFRAIVHQRVVLPYWRGIVYDTYKDGRWVRTLNDSYLFAGCKNFIKQTIFLEPYSGRILFGLGYPVKMKILKPKGWRVRVGSDGCFKSTLTLTTRIAYEVYSCNDPSVLPPADLARYLKIPDDLNPFLKGFLRTHNISGSADEVAEKLKRLFRSSLFKYSRETKISGRKDPVVEFLFNTHKGWCEHFASATVLLLRSAKIPARLVGGYVGGVWNGMGNYYIVKQNNAHSWVEYFNGRRWKPLDTTPVFPATEKVQFSKIARWLDFLKIRWYLYIISYDYYKQQRFFGFLKKKLLLPKIFRFSINTPEFKLKPVTIRWLVVGLCFVFILLFVIFYRKRFESPVIRLRNILQRSGFEVKKSFGLLELAKIIRQNDRVLAQMVVKFADMWYGMRFGYAPKDYKLLNNILKDIKRHISLLKKGKNSSSNDIKDKEI